MRGQETEKGKREEQYKDALRSRIALRAAGPLPPALLRSYLKWISSLPTLAKGGPTGINTLHSGVCMLVCHGVLPDPTPWA